MIEIIIQYRYSYSGIDRDRIGRFIQSYREEVGTRNEKDSTDSNRVFFDNSDESNASSR